MRIASTVTDADCHPELPGIDPDVPGFGSHLPYFLILHRCGLAWREFLVSLGGFDGGVIIPHLSADLVAEVHVGAVDVEVSVVKIGATSFTLRCELSQDDTVAATVDVVLVNFDYRGGGKRALTSSERRSLVEHLVS
jgi:acyl-CoA thioester hydrolase